MRYQRVFVKIWHDKEFCSLSHEAQRLYLYLLTGPQSNLAGIYILKAGYVTEDLGLCTENYESLLGEVVRAGLVRWDSVNKSVLLPNYLKYNPAKSASQLKAVAKELDNLPQTPLLKDFMDMLIGYKIVYGIGYADSLIQGIRKKLDTVSISVTVTEAVSGTVTGTVTEAEAAEKEVEIDFLNDCEEIINYLNKRTGTNYKPTRKETQTLIRARINEGFVVEDFKKVIDNKTAEWLTDDKMRAYLRPITLFSGKFEGYLNKISSKVVRKEVKLPSFTEQAERLKGREGAKNV